MDADAFGEQSQYLLAAVFDSLLDGCLDGGRQLLRIESFAGLKAKPLEPGECLNLLVTVRLLGETGVVQHETDPAQEVHALEFPRLPDRFHAGIGGIVAFGDRHVLGFHVLPAGGNPLAERHDGDMVLNRVDDL